VALYAGPLSEFLDFVNNFGSSPSSTPGTSVAASTSANTKGSWTAVLSALASKGYGIYVRLSDAASSSEDRQHLVDIGVDPAGGTSYSVVIPDLNGGNVPAIANGCVEYYFPIEIPAGATVAARTQHQAAAARTIRVGVQVDLRPTVPWAWPSGAIVERIGAVTNSRGVSFTPGNATDGSWVSLGTLTYATRWVQLGYALSASVANAERTYVDLGAGPTGSQRVLMRGIYAGQSGPITMHRMAHNLLWSRACVRLPAGTELWVRGHCENAPDTTYNALAYALSA